MSTKIYLVIIFVTAFCYKSASQTVGETTPSAVQAKDSSNTKPSTAGSNTGNTTTGKSHSFIFTYPCILLKCDINGNASPVNDTVVAYQYTGFDTIGRSDTAKGYYLLIKFWNWHTPRRHPYIFGYGYTDNDSNRINRGLKYNGNYYLLKRSDFKNRTETEAVHINKMQWYGGTEILPFMLRPYSSSDVFAAQVNIGAVGGINYSLSTNTYIQFTLGIGLGQISLDSANTNGKTATVTQVSVVKPSFNVLLGTKVFQAGLSWGFDFVNQGSALNRSYMYSGKYWIGAGIGINFSTANSTTSTNNK